MRIFGKPGNYQERMERRLSMLRVACREVLRIIEEKKLELVPHVEQWRELRRQERELTMRVLAANPGFKSALQRAPARSHVRVPRTVRVGLPLPAGERSARVAKALETRHRNVALAARLAAVQARINREDAARAAPP